MIGCMFSMLFLGAGAGEADIDLKEVGVKLPPTVSGIRFISRRDFPIRELGYGVNYSNKMCTVSLIVYDLGKKGIPNGKDNELVLGQFKQGIKDVEQGERSGFIRNLRHQKGDLGLPKEVAAKFVAAGFTFDVKEGPCKSYLLLGGQSGHFLKIRITQFIVDGRDNEVEIHGLLRAIAKQLK